MNKRTILATTILCFILAGVATSLMAGYYKSDFFPIGLTGLNSTGSGQQNNCPYENVPGQNWSWDGDPSEQNLIFDLGVNCIGCQDAKSDYLIDFTDRYTVNYINKVCKPSLFNDSDTSNDVYLIPASYSAERYITYYTGSCSNPTTIDSSFPRTEIPASAFYRSYLVWDGYGDVKFGSYNPNGGDTVPNCCQPKYDNWNKYDGGNAWHRMADSAVAHFKQYLSDNNDTLTKCIWGLNLLTENPAMYRRENYSVYKNNSWRGCWAGVDYVLTGHRGRSKFTSLDDAPHGGYRSVEEDSLQIPNRMIVAKGEIACLDRGGYNIFEWLPEIDAFITYSHQWARPYWNYGDQGMFDCFLYGDTARPPDGRSGRQDIAIYFQRYGKTPGGSAGQKRRWLETIDVAWYQTGESWGASRRPCPPEIRCATYLSLARGAKGIFFHAWTCGNTPANYPDATIPSSYVDLDTSNVGIRDHMGYPFGDTNSPDKDHHWLNNGSWGSGDSTYWHGPGRGDHTYYYLDTLITELKKITDVLIDLDWVNGYSLNSTYPEWVSPCSHEYVLDVSGVSYMDLALFDHPYEPIGVEYFMLVNREGIADMTNRNVSVALDAGHWPEADSLILTNIANKDNPRTLTREGKRFIFSEEFEPGEGKLYRVAPAQEPPITYISKGGAR